MMTLQSIIARIIFDHLDTTLDEANSVATRIVQAIRSKLFR